MRSRTLLLELIKALYLSNQLFLYKKVTGYVYALVLC